MSPLPIGVLCAAIVVGSVALSNPFAIAACAAAAALLLWASPPPRGAYVWFALTSALLVFLVNPFVSVQGLTPVWQGPQIPILDTQITHEELVFGIAAGLRLVARRSRSRRSCGWPTATACCRPGPGRAAIGHDHRAGGTVAAGARARRGRAGAGRAHAGG